MPSTAYLHWTTIRADALDEMARAHVAVGGTKRGRRYATQQINRAYAVLLASQFQGFCRDLQSESVDHIVSILAPSAELLHVVSDEFVRGRLLDRGNAQPSSLHADFGRLGIGLWAEVDRYDPAGPVWRAQLEFLNTWRNAIAHQDFDPAKLGGTIVLRLAQVRQWRTTCEKLAEAFDDVMRGHLLALTRTPPW